MIGNGGESRDHFTDSRAVDVRDITEIKEKLLIAFSGQIAHCVPKAGCSFAQRNASGCINYGYVPDFPRCQFNAHEYNLPIVSLYFLSSGSRYFTIRTSVPLGCLRRISNSSTKA